MTAPALEGATQTVAGPPRVGRPYDRFELPKSIVADSQHWHGSDSDLIFGLREPTGGEANSLAAEKINWEDAVPRFIVMIGDRPVTDYTQALMWWQSVLTAKARTAITHVFLRMIVPTDEEGEGLFASRKRVA